MSATESIGRNDPCPCGSGQKYKLCCEGRHDVVSEARKSPWLIGGAAAIGLGVVATIAMQLGDPKPSEVNRSFSSPPPTQSRIADPASILSPLGPAAGAPAAPPGKVWSAEHGHYHDIAGNELAAAPSPLGTPPTAAPGTLTPQPDGPIPEGKVWSAEHGHWHDAPGVTPEIKIGGDTGEIVPIPAPAEQAPPPPKPADSPVTPPK